MYILSMVNSEPKVSFIALIVSLLFMIFYIFCSVRIFRKAGYGGWELFVPIYNYICQFRIAGLNPLFVLLLLVPVVNFFIFVIVSFRTFKVFGVPTGLAVVFLLFPFVGMPVIALSRKYQYEGYC